MLHSSDNFFWKLHQSDFELTSKQVIGEIRSVVLWDVGNIDDRGSVSCGGDASKEQAVVRMRLCRQFS